MNKYIELAKKLKALRDRGTGGEAANAERMLNDLLRKHNISMEDIEDEKLTDRYFNIEPGDVKLFIQIVRRVNVSAVIAGPIPKSKMKYFGITGNWIISVSDSDYIEIDAKYDFFKKLLKGEYEIFFHAFCDANDLLVENTNAVEQLLTQEDIDNYTRMREMSKKIKKGQFNRQIQ